MAPGAPAQAALGGVMTSGDKFAAAETKAYCIGGRGLLSAVQRFGSALSLRDSAHEMDARLQTAPKSVRSMRQSEKHTLPQHGAPTSAATHR